MAGCLAGGRYGVGEGGGSCITVGNGGSGIDVGVSVGTTRIGALWLDLRTVYFIFWICLIGVQELGRDKEPPLSKRKPYVM